MHRIRSTNGLKLSSKKGWFYLSLGAEIYNFHLALGRLAVTWETSAESRAARRAARKAARS